MAHTLPDFTTKYKLVKVFAHIDEAELAARLEGLSTMDRRGNLSWCDDFEAAAFSNWLNVPAAGGSIALATDRSWRGNQSLKTVTAALIGSQNPIEKSFCLSVEHTIGAEFMFLITTGKPLVRFTFTGYTGDLRFSASVRYNHNTNVLEYEDSAGVWQDLLIADQVTTLYETWFYLKLVVDWATGEFKRIIFCSTEYDMTGIPMISVPDVSLKIMDVWLYSTAQTAAAATVYFDNFILTQNE
jgi:hypothetical protein